MLVLGLVILLLGKTAPGLSAELADLLARTGYENLGRLLEELGLQAGRCICRHRSCRTELVRSSRSV